MNPFAALIEVTTCSPQRDEAELEIEARDKGTPSKASVVPIKLKITQTVNAYPQWFADYSATPIPLPENVPVNYVVKRLKAVSTVRDATVSGTRVCGVCAVLSTICRGIHRGRRRQEQESVVEFSILHFFFAMSSLFH